MKSLNYYKPFVGEIEKEKKQKKVNKSKIIKDEKSDDEL